MRHITQRGFDFIKRFEAFSEYPYICPAGKSTIGYGHVILDSETIDEPLSEETGELILAKDIERAEKCVLRNTHVPLLDGQFDALVSLTFNAGNAAYQRSQIRMRVNRGDFEEAAEWFPRSFITANGKIVHGLIRRRLDEREMFIE
jgi:GH24 family phage-related lysozyme (muramidase)